jgi:hypothetical protein
VVKKLIRNVTTILPMLIRRSKSIYKINYIDGMEITRRIY